MADDDQDPTGLFAAAQGLAVGYLMQKYGLTEISFTLDEAPDGPAALEFNVATRTITITRLAEGTPH